MAEVALSDVVAAICGPRQEEDGLLNVGGEEEQVHDLRDAGAGDVAEASGLGRALDLASVERALEMVSKGEEASHTRDGSPSPVTSVPTPQSSHTFIYSGLLRVP